MDLRLGDRLAVLSGVLDYGATLAPSSRRDELMRGAPAARGARARVRAEAAVVACAGAPLFACGVQRSPNPATYCDPPRFVLSQRWCTTPSATIQTHNAQSCPPYAGASASRK